MFDESHMLSQPGLIAVPVDAYVSVPEEYKKLQKVIDRWNT